MKPKFIEAFVFLGLFSFNEPHVLSLVGNLTGFIEANIENKDLENPPLPQKSTTATQCADYLMEVPVRKSDCRAPFAAVGSSCLFMDTLKKTTFKEAKSHCQELGGHLARFTDANQFQQALRFINDVVYIKDTSVWIGGSDEEIEGHWKWLTGDMMPVGAPFWGSIDGYKPEPQGGTAQNCAGLYHVDLFYVHDFPCTSLHFALCQQGATTLSPIALPAS